MLGYDMFVSGSADTDADHCFITLKLFTNAEIASAIPVQVPSRNSRDEIAILRVLQTYAELP
jgi:hypothetical protein